MFKTTLRGALLTTTLGAGAIGAMHIKYSPLMKPKPIKFDQSKDKRIVIVGAGVVGLTTAYLLSSNPLNKLTVIERNKKPYQETSL